MLAETPHARNNPDPTLQTTDLDAPARFVERYVELSRQRREIEEQLAFVRSELELIAASSLREAAPRGRFVAPSGRVVAARLMPTCSFDRAAVARELQRGGRLDDVATLPGPSLARFLDREPVWAARLQPLVRRRHSVMLMTGV